MNKNIPFSHLEMVALPLGTTSSGDYPNRSFRRKYDKEEVVRFNNRKLTVGRLKLLLHNFRDKAGNWLLNRSFLVKHIKLA